MLQRTESDQLLSDAFEHAINTGADTSYGPWRRIRAHLDAMREREAHEATDRAHLRHKNFSTIFFQYPEHVDVALSTALRVAADLHGSSGAATPDELRELAEDAERLERAASAPFPLPELAEVLRDARRYREWWDELPEERLQLSGEPEPYPEPRLHSVLPYTDEHYPSAGDERWLGTVAVEVEWAPGARALYGVYPAEVRERVDRLREHGVAWELWQD